MLANRSSYINVYQINLIVPPSSVGFQLPGGRCLLFTFSAHLLLPTQIDPGMFKRQNDSSTTTNLLYEAFLHLFNTLSKQYGGGGGVVFDDEGGIPGVQGMPPHADLLTERDSLLAVSTPPPPSIAHSSDLR